MAQSQSQTSPKSTKTQRGRVLTHTAIAREYIDRHWQDTAFMRSAWYRYLDGVWTEKHDLVIEHEVWNLLEEFEQNQQCRPTASIHNSVQKRVKARFFVPDEQVDFAQNLINLQNGVYSLDDGSVYSHDPSFYFTTQLPFSYDPAAKAPTWEAYILTTFVKPHTTEHDPELAAFVQEAFAYSLTASVRFHISFWCYGEGANGKGTLLYALEKLSGNAAAPLNVGLLRREQYQLAEMAGKKVAMCSESSATSNLVEDALIKALISGDTMRVRQIHRKAFTLHPIVKLWWTMNDLPAVADTSEGFWRRCRVVPFNRQFMGAERILDLKERLARELPGIFNWAMEGLKRLNQQGNFTTPQQVLKATNLYRKESNPVALFVDERCFVGPNYEAQSSLIYREYKDWCLQTGHKPKSTPRFKREMERLHLFHKSKPKFNVFQGVALKSSVPFP
jgi:putative DNA primase/helicase